MKLLPFMVFFITAAIMIQGADALTVKLLVNTDKCTYHPEMGKDFCYSTYEISGLVAYEPQKTAFRFKTDKNEAFFDRLSGLDATLTASKVGQKTLLNITAWKNPFLNVDNVPCYDGECFYEYAWWNTSLTRWAVNTSWKYADPFLVNDTYGLDIGGGIQYIWCQNNTVYIYNDTAGWLYCTDDSTQVKTFIDEGNGTGWGDADDSLQLWYHMNSTTLYDSSHNHASHSISGGVTSVGGKIGHSLDFNGTNGYIDLGNNAFEQSVITVLGWFMLDEPASGDYEFIFATSGSRLGFGVFADNYFTISHYSNVDACENAYNTTIYITPGTWYFIAMTLSDTTGEYKAYLNGTLVEYETSCGPLQFFDDGTKYTRIGYGYENYFGGKIDEFRIYNRVLSANEITHLYNNTAPTGYSQIQEMEIYNGTAETLPTSIAYRYCADENYLYVSEPCVDNCSQMAVYLEYCSYGCSNSTFSALGNPGCKESPWMLVLIAFLLVIFVVLIVRYLL